MKSVILIILLMCLQVAHAQFAFVKDSDGFVNIRSTETLGDNITDTLHNGHIVYCLETFQDWVMIDYQKNGIQQNGYVYKNKLQLISSYKPIPQISKKNNSITLKRDSISVTITKKPFVKADNKIVFTKKGEYISLAGINGKSPWGTDNTLPKQQYNNFIIHSGKANIVMPGNEYDDLYEPNLRATICYYDAGLRRLYIAAENGDAAGSYAVLWVFENNKFKERVMAYGF